MRALAAAAAARGTDLPDDDKAGPIPPRSRDHRPAWRGRRHWPSTGGVPRPWN